MAMFDDTRWLLSHVQNSYATSDDSGLSEVVLQGEWPAEVLGGLPFPSMDYGDGLTNERSSQASDGGAPHSLDVMSDLSMIGHRFRTNTAHRLDKMKKEKNLQAKITRVTWQPHAAARASARLSESEAEELFGARPVAPLSERRFTSALSQLLEQHDLLEDNPYLSYAKWDGNTEVTQPSMLLSIYVFSEGEARPPRFPMSVCVVASARVSDLVGLVCFLHTRDNFSPPITGPASQYSLHMTEEDGSVDWTFHCLPYNHTIDKFGFSVLALVKSSQPTPLDHHHPVTVTVHISGGVFSQIECESSDVLLQEVLRRTVARRREMAKVVEAGVQYHLERGEDAPDTALPLEWTLSQANTLHLYAVRDNSKRAAWPDEERGCDGVGMGGGGVGGAGSTSHTFQVTWLKKWAKFQATLDVSYDGVYLSVTGGGGGGGLLRPPHPVSYPRERVACCKLKVVGGGGKAGGVGGAGSGRKPAALATKAEGGKKSEGGEKSGGRTEVVLTCEGEQRFKDYVLECEDSVALELVEAVKRIKIEESSSKKLKEDEKPRRRYSLVGLKKKNRSSYNMKGNH